MTPTGNSPTTGVSVRHHRLAVGAFELHVSVNPVVGAFPELLEARRLLAGHDACPAASCSASSGWLVAVRAGGVNDSG